MSMYRKKIQIVRAGGCGMAVGEDFLQSPSVACEPARRYILHWPTQIAESTVRTIPLWGTRIIRGDVSMSSVFFNAMGKT
jgi:hypothetical protein